MQTLKNEWGSRRSVSMKSIRKMCLGASRGKLEARTALPICVEGCMYVWYMCMYIYVCVDVCVKNIICYMYVCVGVSRAANWRP